LHDGLLPHLKDRIERRMSEYAASPDKLYEYLKAYLMLGDPQHLDKSQLAFVADLEWQSDANRGTADALSRHFKSLLTEDRALGSMALNESLVSQARATIRQASIPTLVYNRLKLIHSDDAASRGVKLDEASGIGAEQVLRRRSGRKLSEPIPYMYTAAGFKDVTAAGASELVKQFNADSWVWGERGVPGGDAAALGGQVMDLYEKDYIAQWDFILRDVEPMARTPEQIAIIASPQGSPLRGFLAAIDANTYLVKPPEPGAAGASSGIVDSVRNKIFGSAKTAVGAPTVPPGTAVTNHFASIHRTVSGSPAPIDIFIGKMQDVRQQALAAGSGPGKTVVNDQLSQQITALIQDAAILPTEVRNLVKQVGESTAATVRTSAATEMSGSYAALVRDCKAAIDGRYPFNQTSATEVPVEDFGRVFGYNGLFDSFFKANLEKMVDTNRSPWSLRAGAVGVSLEMLRKFEEAEKVRRMFFQPGSAQPQITFTLIPTDLDSRTAKFNLVINGKKYEYKQGQTSNFRPAWPGDGGGQVVVSFDGGLLSRVDTKTFDGPWALFRFVDFGVPTRETAERMVLHLELSGHRVAVRFDADRIDNPFTNRSWQQFRCF
jgi:type VI secretion system protein ImpL